jgi:hypothetical protein
MQHRQQLFVGVAFVVTTIFLGVSYAGESADYIPACPTKFIKWPMQTPSMPDSLMQRPWL